MRIFFIIILCASILTACKGKEQKIVNENIKKESDSIFGNITQQLPFVYTYPENISEIYTIEDFLKNENIASDSISNNLFNAGTVLNFRTYKYGHPYYGKAYFFKRLPDLNKNKILLFAYLDKDTDYMLPAIELQVFDPTGKIIDKMIVVDGTSYECSWTRNFEISKNYELKIIDRDICWDLEEDKKISDTQNILHYKIDEQGKINRLITNLISNKNKGDEDTIINDNSWSGKYLFQKFNIDNIKTSFEIFITNLNSISINYINNGEKPEIYKNIKAEKIDNHKIKIIFNTKYDDMGIIYIQKYKNEYVISGAPISVINPGNDEFFLDKIK